MSRNGYKNRKGDAQLILALAIGRSIRDAAKSAGLSTRTVERRLNDHSFNRRVADVQSALIAEAVGRLTGASGEAADRLRGLLKSRNERIRLSAARAILEIGARLKESVELERRIAELERALALRDEEAR